MQGRGRRSASPPRLSLSLFAVFHGFLNPSSQIHHTVLVGSERLAKARHLAPPIPALRERDEMSLSLGLSSWTCSRSTPYCCSDRSIRRA